jgi:hypothetical protein
MSESPASKLHRPPSLAVAGISTRIHVLAAIFYFIHTASVLVLPCHRHISLPLLESTSPDVKTTQRPVTYVDFYICPARWPASVHTPAAPSVASCARVRRAGRTAAVPL